MVLHDLHGTRWMLNIKSNQVCGNASWKHPKTTENNELDPDHAHICLMLRDECQRRRTFLLHWLSNYLKALLPDPIFKHLHCLIGEALLQSRTGQQPKPRGVTSHNAHCKIWPIIMHVSVRVGWCTYWLFAAQLHWSCCSHSGNCFPSWCMLELNTILEACCDPCETELKI